MNGTITLNDAQEDQILKYTIDNFSSYTRPKVQNKKDEKKNLTPANVNELFNGRQKHITSFQSRIFPIRNTNIDDDDDDNDDPERTMILPIILNPPPRGQQVGNTSENRLNEIRQIVYLLYQT